MKEIDCPFCYQSIPEDSETCPECLTSFGKKAKSCGEKHIGKHSCGSGDQSRKTEGGYEGGYVD